MTVLSELITLALLVLVAKSESPTFISTEHIPTTTERMVECSCMSCEYNPERYTVHTQADFCNSAAVVQGRVTQKFLPSENKGVWNQAPHHSAFPNRYFPQTHFELTVRILAVYSDQSGHDLKVGDKVTVRYKRDPSCPACQTLVEDFSDFSDDSWKERELYQREKYIFFLPNLEAGYGERLESTLQQCTRVWKYSKRGKVAEGGIPNVQRFMLTATNCDKCRVSGCYQNKCVKADEVEECTESKIWSLFCPEIMSSGLCYYHSGTDSCRWTSITEDGFRSRKVIEHCLL